MDELTKWIEAHNGVALAKPSDETTVIQFPGVSIFIYRAERPGWWAAECAPSNNDRQLVRVMGYGDTPLRAVLFGLGIAELAVKAMAAEAVRRLEALNG
jgi:hypothetical protein